MVFRRIYLRSYEVGLRFVRGEFAGVVRPGVHWFRTVFPRTRVEVFSRRDPFLRHRDIYTFVRSEALAEDVEILDLADDERALVWIDGRFEKILTPGLHAYWTGVRDVVTDVVTTEGARFDHPQRDAIEAGAGDRLSAWQVPSGARGVLFVKGGIREVLGPGRYLLWTSVPGVTVNVLDTREIEADINGQDIMTADKVTVRVNASLCTKVADVRKVVSVAEDPRQILYREAQLALREAIGARALTALLDEKAIVGPQVLEKLRGRAAALGLEVVSLGIRDLILPGDMRELLNRVTEAKSAAEANQITRREETAAMRSQANTAKMLEQNPTLMRLKELETVERVSENAKLQVVLGEKGLADRIVNLI
jgi:regulator of protease activity HflC (stomatin/prohibitin superfamily)